MSFEWKEIQLKDLVTLKRGYDLPKSLRNDGQYPILASNGVTGYHNEFMVKGPGIVTGRSGTLGEVHYIEGNYWPLNTTLYGQDYKGNDVKFIYYFLKTLNLQNYNTGSSVPTLNRNHVHSLLVKVPSVKEQQNISLILWSLDQKIQLNNAINKNLEEIAQAIFKHWFVDFEFPNENGEPYKSSGGEFEESELGLIPKGWKVGKLTEVFDVLSGGTPKTNISEYWNGHIPFFTPKDIANSYYVIDTEKYLTEEGLENCNSKLYSKGTVFITARGTVGKVAIAGSDMAMNQSCYALVAKKGFTQKYIFLLSLQLIDTLKKNASGAVFDAITKSTFQSLNTIIPDFATIRRFSEFVNGIFSSMLNNIKENHSLKNIRDTLLPKLMSGEIRVPLEQDYSEQELLMVAEAAATYET